MILGKNKLKRFAEMADFPNVVQPSLEEVLNRDHQLKGKWKTALYGNDHPLTLELGCGKGEYTVGLAREYPDRNFLGIDIKGARMWRGAKEALESKLPNVYFLRTRIDFIGSFFARDEVDDIWITFPDPQLKDNRERKRLTHPMFLDRYRNFLQPAGTVNLKTDSRELYDYTLEVIRNEKLELLEATDDLYDEKAHFNDPLAREPLVSIRTFYESMHLKKGKKICYLKFRLNR